MKIMIKQNKNKNKYLRTPNQHTNKPTTRKHYSPKSCEIVLYFSYYLLSYICNYLYLDFCTFFFFSKTFVFVYLNLYKSLKCNLHAMQNWKKCRCADWVSLKT